MIKLDNIEENLRIIEDRAPMVVLEYRDKLKDRIKDLLEGNIELDEDRLSNEVAFFLQIKAVLMKKLLG